MLQLPGDEPTEGAQENEYDAILKNERLEKRDGLRRSAYFGAKQEPERWSKILDLSRKTGRSPQYVDRNFDKLSQDVKKPSDAEYDNLIQNAPKAADWILDPGNMTLAQGKLDKIAELEKTWARLSNPNRPKPRTDSEIEAAAKKRAKDLTVEYRRKQLVDPWTGQVRGFQTPEDAEAAFLKAELESERDREALLQEDEKKLGFFGRAFTAFGLGFQHGEETNALGLRGYSEQRGDISPENKAEIERLSDGLAQTPQGENFASRWIYPSAKVIGQITDSLWRSKEYAIAGGAAGANLAAIAGQAGPQVALPEEVISIPGMAAKGAMLGLQVGLAEQSYMIESGHAYLELSKVRGENGEELGEGVKQAASSSVGVLNAALEIAGLKFATAPFKSAFKSFFREGVKDMAVKPTAKKALLEFGKNYALAVGGEVATEVMQEGVNILAEEVGKMVTSGEFETLANSPAQREQAVERLISIASETFRGMAFLGLPGPSAKMAADVHRAKKNEEYFKRVDEVIADNADLIELDPVKAQELIAQQTKGTPAEFVYVPAKPLFTYLQSAKDEDGKPIDAVAMLEGLGVDKAQIVSALQSDADVAIPTAAYAVQIVPSEHKKFFQDEVRPSPDDMNRREVQEFTKRIEEERAKIQEESQPEQAEEVDPVAAVAESIRTSLEGARVPAPIAETYATVYESLFRTLAKRSGIDPVKLFKQYGVTVQRPLEELRRTEPATPEQADPSKVFRQPGEREDRGEIEIGKGFANIDLLKTADRSTFMHESGHLYLEVLADLSEAEGAAVDLKADYQTVLEWLGAKDRKGITKEMHEKWARGFEAYLMEGNAPSKKLRAAFSRFKEWLLNIYKTLTALNVELTPEVRGVMDRLLATQEEIQAARVDQNFQPLSPHLKALGMSDEEIAAYEEKVREAQQADEETLANTLIKDFRRMETAWYREEREKVRREFETQINARPVYRAQSVLRNGKLPDGSELPEGTLPPGVEKLKLDMGVLVKRYGKERLKKLSFLYARDGGIHPDVVAEAFGFQSGEALVEALQQAEPRVELIDRMTDERMKDLYGDLMTKEALKEEAMNAVHNEARGELLALDARMLAKKLKKRTAPLALMREAADRIVSEKRVDQLDPRIPQRAQARAAQTAFDAAAKGDWDTALQAVQTQILNHEIYRSMAKAKDGVKEFVDEDLKRIFGSDEKLAKTRDMDFVNAARAVLAEFALAPKGKPANEFLKQMREYAPDVYETMIDRINLATEGAKPYREASVAAFFEMKEVVESLWDLSRRERQIEIDGKKLDRDEVIKELEARITQIRDRKEINRYTEAKGAWHNVKMGYLGTKASLRRVESWVDAMDGGNPDGPFRKYVWQPISEAANEFREAKKEYLKRLVEILKPIERDLRGGQIVSDELGHRFGSLGEVLGAILHTGNESSLSKLLRGRNWGKVDENGVLDTSRWDAFVSRLWRDGALKKEHYDVIQKVWDLFEELKPQAQKAHKGMYGFYFSEITANSVVTPFGTYKGGYAPAMVDTMESEDASIREERDALQNLDNSHMFPTTGRGFTKKRQEGYAAPLQLDLRLVPMHLDKALRFIHLEPRVKDVSRVVMNHGFRSSLRAVDATVASDMLVPWLQRAAQQKVMTPLKGWGGKAATWFFRTLRRNAGLNIMVGNVTNALQQFTGLIVAGVKVKPRFLRDALWEYTRHPLQMAEDIREKSVFMRSRTTEQAGVFQTAMDEILVGQNLYQKGKVFVDKHGYFLQSSAQNIVDNITWMGAYEQATEEGADEKSAVRQADSAVRLTQGSGTAEDLSRFETGNAVFRVMTMFISYFNMKANLLGTEFLKGIRDMGLKPAYGRLLYVYLLGLALPAAIGRLIYNAMRGKLGDDDDDGYMDEAMATFFGSQAQEVAAAIPGFGQAVQYTANRFDKSIYNDKLQASPAISALEAALGSPSSVRKAIFEDGSKKAATGDALTAIGMLFGLPVAPLKRPLGYLIDEIED